ncbi:hypothetical protein KGQ20_14450 [Catenulispora sp. NF23]|uniref:hypothetical protein n=1 Tax=Catenulispora pinistramenti TaxID=2705254 RepID=UPI001BADDD33|nr:hypothetical protein [Catenulispora pinistramenti]MBS2533972.1 hypothetical protein [Catenulispora pinistramenti]
MAKLVPDMDIGKKWIRGLPKGLPKILQIMSQVMKTTKTRGVSAALDAAVPKAAAVKAVPGHARKRAAR